MSRKAIIFYVIFVFLISLAGCATTGRHEDLEIQGLKNQISVLEAQIESKDEEISGLREALAKTQAEEKPELSRQAGKKRMIGEVKSRPTVKQVQTALQNAGYYSGSIDGQAGKRTRDAIRAFQKANDLKEDGRVGRKTWSLLKEYLFKKVK